LIDLLIASATASATVHVNVITCQVHDEPNYLKESDKTEVTATANASVKTQTQVTQKTQTTQQKTSQDDPISRVASPKVTKNRTPSSNALEVFNSQDKSSPKEAAKNRPPTPNTLEIFNPLNRSSSKRSSLHTLDVSTLKPQDLDASNNNCTELEPPTLGATYRKRSESFEDENSFSLKVIGRTKTDLTLFYWRAPAGFIGPVLLQEET
jgi:hypothetical protein